MNLRMLNEDPYLHWPNIIDNELPITYAHVSLHVCRFANDDEDQEHHQNVHVTSITFYEEFFELNDKNKLSVIKMLCSSFKSKFKYLHVTAGECAEEGKKYLSSIGLEEESPELIPAHQHVEAKHYDTLYRVPTSMQRITEKPKAKSKNELSQLLNRQPGAQFDRQKPWHSKLPEVLLSLRAVPMAIAYYKKNGNGERWPELENIFKSQIRHMANSSHKANPPQMPQELSPLLFDYLGLLNEPWPEGHTSALETANKAIKIAAYILRTNHRFTVQSQTRNIQDYINAYWRRSTLKKFLNNKYFKLFIVNNFPHDAYELLYGDARKIPKRLRK